MKYNSATLFNSSTFIPETNNLTLTSIVSLFNTHSNHLLWIMRVQANGGGEVKLGVYGHGSFAVPSGDDYNNSLTYFTFEIGTI